MAKFTPKEKTKKAEYPSACGSHTSMVNQEATKKLHPLVEFDDLNKNDLVVLTAEHGDYLTPKERLDTGLADVNRYQ